MRYAAKPLYDISPEEHNNYLAEISNLGRRKMRHQTISFIKSAIRIIGYIALPISIIAAAMLLILSEIVGVVEEIGHD
jgi:hypothetical protein